MSSKLETTHHLEPLKTVLTEPLTVAFPELSQAFNWSFVQKIEVPPAFKENAGSSLIKMGKRQEQVQYYLATQLQQRQEKLLPEPLSLTEAHELVRVTFLDLNLNLNVSSSDPGFRILQNHAVARLYQRLGLETLLPQAFTVEADQFALALTNIKNQIITDRVAQNLPPVESAILDSWVNELLKNGLTQSLQECVSIITQGPPIRNIFSSWATETATAQLEIPLTNHQAKDFLSQNFPAELNTQEIRIAKVSGSAKYLFMHPSGFFQELDIEEYRNKITELGIQQVAERTMASAVPYSTGWIEIKLYNLALDFPEVIDINTKHLDYISPSLTQAQKLAVWLLGLLAHESLHRLQSTELMQKYQAVAQTTWNDSSKVWQGYPSQYARMYTNEFALSPELLLLEDMAEAVQIYVINSEYLQHHFPERLEFIQTNFPHLQPDSATLAVLGK